MENNKLGARFLHERNSKLHTTKPVENASRKEKSQKPVDKINTYLERFERVLNPEPLEGHQKFDRKARNLELLRGRLFKEAIIDSENIPESYFQNQQRLAREQGHGDIEITDELRLASAENITADQKSTLNTWIDYFASSDSNSFPMWAKYWAFTGTLKLSTFDKETHTFAKRAKDTTAPFPDLNREALAYVVDLIIKKIESKNEGNQEQDEELKKLLEKANFGKLYAWAIEKVTPTEGSELANTRGEWIKYHQGSDHMPLVNSLQGHGTGWCTAGENTAQTQLQSGDFYVYYTYDKNDKPIIPRIAIRMENERIGEVRGIAKEQNLDEYIANSDVLQTKLEEFGTEGERYQKRSGDMQQLTLIDNKVKNNQELSAEELSFLYQDNGKIQGFGYYQDPRIREILRLRNKKVDFSKIFNCLPEQISFTKKDALSGVIKYHFGDLDLSDLTSTEGLKLPEVISGMLNLSSLTSAEGLIFPKEVDILDLNGLTSDEGLLLPKKVDSLLLGSLTSTKGLVFPEEVYTLALNGLTSFKSLVIPKSVVYLYLNRDIPSTEKQELRLAYPNIKIYY